MSHALNRLRYMLKDELSSARPFQGQRVPMADRAQLADEGVA